MAIDASMSTSTPNTGTATPCGNEQQCRLNLNAGSPRDLLTRSLVLRAGPAKLLPCVWGLDHRDVDWLVSLNSPENI